MRAKTVAEFIAYAKANPGKLNFAAPTGGPPHLAGEIQARRRHHIAPVHYRGMNQAITDLLAGQMDIVFDAPAPLAPFIGTASSGRWSSLGASAWRSCADVPTMVESGLPDIQIVTWNGLVAPAGTPDDVVSQTQCLDQ